MKTKSYFDKPLVGGDANPVKQTWALYICMMWGGKKSYNDNTFYFFFDSLHYRLLLMNHQCKLNNVKETHNQKTILS